LTNYANSVKVLSQRIKEKMPEVVTVLGGPHATYFYGEILDDMPGIDYVIYGEADSVVQDYFQLLGGPKNLHKLNGLVYRNGEGKTVINPPAGLVQNLDDIPIPAWHLYDMSLYRPLPKQYRNLPFFSMVTSRGCWWQKCKFCFQAGKNAVRFRRQSPERVVREIEILYHDYGIREIGFWDIYFTTQVAQEI
jgi:anaerobic magnesium-protoporphyrin IX monomethyl ester cyclase